MAAIEGISNLSNSGVNYQQAKPAPKVEAVSENVSQQVNQEVASQVVTVKQTEEKNGKDSDKQQNGKEEQQANPERIKTQRGRWAAWSDETNSFEFFDTFELTINDIFDRAMISAI